MSIGLDQQLATSLMRRTLRRPDGVAMIVSVTVWCAVAMYSSWVNGDSFLLIMPLIFLLATVLLYLISSWFSRGRWFGAAVICTLSTVLIDSYPL